MEKEELVQVALLERDIGFEDRKVIELSPRYQDVNEDIPTDVDQDHENFFQWKRNEEQSTLVNNFLMNNPSVILVRSRHNKKPNSFKWTTETPIDVSGLPSVHRILVIRDITQRLRLLDKGTDEANKMFTWVGQTTINFKLKDVKFSLLLAPKKKQPGNAFLIMQSNAGEPYGERHDEVERFDCFAKLDAKEIDSIVSRARRTGVQITDRDINISEEDEVKQKMAEEMNFFMLLYDFEVARRLQRPFSDDSRQLDTLPIGIGIAMIHCINKSKKKNDEWKFFSELFKDDWESRKGVLRTICDEFEECKESSEVGMRAELINNMLLAEQFGSQE